MARSSDLLSGLLLAATGFMEGKLIKRERERQAKMVADKMKAEEEQQKFLNSLRMAEEQRRASDQAFEESLRPYKTQEMESKAKEAGIEVGIKELALKNAPAAEAADLAYRNALAAQARAGAAENAAQAEKARKDAANSLSDAEQIILKGEVETAQKQILGTGESVNGGGGFKDVSNAVADESRKRLEAYMDQYPVTDVTKAVKPVRGVVKMPGTEGFNPREFGQYLRSNPAAQDSLLAKQIATMRGGVRPQVSTTGSVAESGGETEAMRQGNAFIERLAKARGNPGDPLYQDAQQYFRDPEAGYIEVMRRAAAKYSTQRAPSPYAVRPAQDNSSIFDAIRKRY